MKLKNIKLISKTITTAKGNIAFDKEGIAEVSDELGNGLLGLEGYEVVESVKEAPKNANVENSSDKEEKSQETQNTTSDEDLESKNVIQLRKIAKDKNIDLKGASKKEEILAILEANK